MGRGPALTASGELRVFVQGWSDTATCVVVGDISGKLRAISKPRASWWDAHVVTDEGGQPLALRSTVAA